MPVFRPVFPVGKRQTCPKRPRTSLPAAAPPRGVHPSALCRDGRLSVPEAGGHLSAPQAYNPTPSPFLPPVTSRRPRRRIHALRPAPLARPAPTAVAHSLLPPLGACLSPRPRTGRLHLRHRPRPTSHCPGRHQHSQPPVSKLVTQVPGGWVSANSHIPTPTCPISPTASPTALASRGSTGAARHS